MIGTEPQRRLEQFAGLLRAIATGLFVEECRSAHSQIDGIRVVRSLANGALIFSPNQRDLQCSCNALRDVVIHLCKLRNLSIEAFCPQL